MRHRVEYVRALHVLKTLSVVDWEMACLDKSEQNKFVLGCRGEGPEPTQDTQQLKDKCFHFIAVENSKGETSIESFEDNYGLKLWQVVEIFTRRMYEIT